MSFECCMRCKAPKRYPGCHDHCTEYAAAKANHDERRAIDERRRSQGVTAQKYDGVFRAFKRKKGRARK